MCFTKSFHFIVTIFQTSGALDGSFHQKSRTADFTAQIFAQLLLDTSNLYTQALDCTNHQPTCFNYESSQSPLEKLNLLNPFLEFILNLRFIDLSQQLSLTRCIELFMTATEFIIDSLQSSSLRNV